VETALKAPMHADPTPMLADEAMRVFRANHRGRSRGYEFILPGFIGGYRRWIGGNRRFHNREPAKGFQ
jgi:hypothetical protein